MIFLIFIFLLVLLFSMLPTYSGDITKRLSRFFLHVSNEELNLRSQVRELKAEQDIISMTDEFARYAKIQRRIDKIMAQVKESNSARMQKSSLLSLLVRIGIYVIQAFTMLALVFRYRNEPLLMFPSEWFYPLEKFVALPTGIPGGLGIACWIMVCTATVYRIKQFLVT
ncbi:tail-anchored protein insertion receptor WRB-like [Mizuhopecten yessoensis]|uniref:tail-anchored protein insertion receptor WRB-like n=1 Tax=Mizuhopecten yessoensis TaxID=6573 RepID=UPI000B457EC2|nr:tail-anchored protein insertion receptor WRB-like [Mizuhopecten yessoensis]